MFRLKTIGGFIRRYKALFVLTVLSAIIALVYVFTADLPEWFPFAGALFTLLDTLGLAIIANRIFGQEGVGILHLSGLIAAMSHETTECCLALAKAAKQYGTLVSFDLNYRASFWAGREDELSAVFSEIASVSDILIGNEEDYQLCLGIKGPEAGGRDIAAKIDSFKEMIERTREQYPDVSVFATTLRQVVNANEHLWGAIMRTEDGWQIVEPRPIHVLDRIGGGDGFVGGMLYAILRGWESEKWIQFGWASGALATTFLTDYAQPADEDQVWSVWSGNARVKR